MQNKFSINPEKNLKIFKNFVKLLKKLLKNLTKNIEMLE